LTPILSSCLDVLDGYFHRPGTIACQPAALSLPLFVQSTLLQGNHGGLRIQLNLPPFLLRLEDPSTAFSDSALGLPALIPKCLEPYLLYGHDVFEMLVLVQQLPITIHDFTGKGVPPPGVGPPTTVRLGFEARLQ